MSQSESSSLPPFFLLTTAESCTSKCLRNFLASLAPGLPHFLGLCYTGDQPSTFMVFSGVPQWHTWFQGLVSSSFPVVLSPKITLTSCVQVDWSSVTPTLTSQWKFRTRCLSHVRDVSPPPDHPDIVFPSAVPAPPPFPVAGSSSSRPSYAASVRGRSAPRRLGHAWSDLHEPAVRPTSITPHRFMGSVDHRDLSVVISLPSPRANLGDTLTACLRLLGWKPSQANPFLGIELIDHLQYVVVCASAAVAHSLIEAGDVETSSGVAQLFPASDHYRLLYLQPLPIYVSEEFIDEAFAPFGEVVTFKRATLCHHESGLRFPTNKGKVLLHLTSDQALPSTLLIAGQSVRVQADVPFSACSSCGSLAHSVSDCAVVVCSNCRGRGHLQDACPVPCKVCHRRDHTFLQCPKRRTGPSPPVSSPPSLPFPSHPDSVVRPVPSSLAVEGSSSSVSDPPLLDTHQDIASPALPAPVPVRPSSPSASDSFSFKRKRRKPDASPASIIAVAADSLPTSDVDEAMDQSHDLLLQPDEEALAAQEFPSPPPSSHPSLPPPLLPPSLPSAGGSPEDSSPSPPIGDPSLSPSYSPQPPESPGPGPSPGPLFSSPSVRELSLSDDSETF